MTRPMWEHGPAVGVPASMPYDQPREAHDEHAHCSCVSEHRPPYLELERHHILPLYLGGPDVAENLVWVCNTTHSSVHELLRLMLKAGGEMTYRQAQDVETRPVARYAYDLALDGYRRWKATQP